MNCGCGMPTLDELEIAGLKARRMHAIDPYLYYAEMPLTAVHYPLGFPLELGTNSEDVLEAAEESWGSFTQQFSTPALQLKVGVWRAHQRSVPLLRPSGRSAILSWGSPAMIISVSLMLFRGFLSPGSRAPRSRIEAIFGITFSRRRRSRILPIDTRPRSTQPAWNSTAAASCSAATQAQASLHSPSHAHVQAGPISRTTRASC